MSDSEVVTVALLAQWLFDGHEAKTLSFIKKRWGCFFKSLLTPSAFNKRIHYLAGFFVQLGPWIAQECAARFQLKSVYEVIDGVGIKTRNQPNGHPKYLETIGADIGVKGVPKLRYLGLKCALSVQKSGLITGYVSGPASTEERWLAEGLFRWRCNREFPQPTASEMDEVLGKTKSKSDSYGRKGPRGPLEVDGVGCQGDISFYFADKGYKGKDWERHWLFQWGAQVLHVGHLEAPPRDEAALESSSQAQRPNESSDEFVRSSAKASNKMSLWKNEVLSRREHVEHVISSLSQFKEMPSLGSRKKSSTRARLGARIARHNLSCFINMLCGLKPLSILEPLLMEWPTTPAAA